MDEQSSAAVAAQRVQAIVEAAEATAREIEEKALEEAAAHVANAQGSVAALVEQATALQRQMDEIAAALGSLKAAVDAMTAPAVEVAAAPEPEPEVAAEPEPEAAAAELEPDPKPADAAPKAPEGARLIALNMALSGKPREETARYLRENFDLEAGEQLLDEVYA